MFFFCCGELQDAEAGTTPVQDAGGVIFFLYFLNGKILLFLLFVAEMWESGVFSVGPIFLFEVHAGSGATCGPKFFFFLTASPWAVDLGAPPTADGSHSLGPTTILRLTVHTVSNWRWAKEVSCRPAPNKLINTEYEIPTCECVRNDLSCVSYNYF